MDTVRVPASPSCGLSTQGRRSQTLSCGTFLWPQERAGPGAVIGGHTVLCTRENSLRLTLETHAPGAAFKENNLTPQKHATGYSVSFAIRGRRTKSRRAPAPRPSGQLKRKTVTAAAAARTWEHRTARTRRAGVRSGSVAPERGTADVEPPRHPAAQSRAAVPEPRKHMFVRRRKKKKRYTSIHNSSAQNSKILEPKRPPTMPWLNRLWRSRIGNIPQPRKGRHGHSTQQPGRVSRVDCGRFLPISFMPRSRNKTTTAGGQIGGFFPRVRSGGGGRARERLSDTEKSGCW